jgi:hypothetical protein
VTFRGSNIERKSENNIAMYQSIGTISHPGYTHTIPFKSLGSLRNPLLFENNATGPFSQMFYETGEHIGRDFRPFLHTETLKIFDILHLWPLQNVNISLWNLMCAWGYCLAAKFYN